MTKGNVFIIGGSRGIGAEMVRLFSRNGYRVAFTYAASHEAAMILSKKTGALAIQANSESKTEMESAILNLHQSLGPVDILIANAAVSHVGLFTDLREEEWERMRQINLDAPMYYTKQLLSDMISKKKGRIILISSMWGLVGASCEVGYSVTKAALIGFTKALAKEVGPSGITVNAIAPGVIDTDMNSCFDEQTKRDLCEETPLCRLGTTLDVARVALFLAEEGGDFITGQVISPNGGFII